MSGRDMRAARPRAEDPRSENLHAEAPRAESPRSEDLHAEAPRARAHQMKRADRAKQFMPFSALKGLEEELSLAEKTPCARRELLEDEAEQLNRALLDLEPGDVIEVECYKNGDYVTLSGPLLAIDAAYRRLQLGDMEIRIADIAAVRRR